MDKGTRRIKKAFLSLTPDEKKYDTFKNKMEKMNSGTWKENIEVHKFYGIKTSNFEEFAKEQQSVIQLTDEQYRLLLKSQQYAEESGEKSFTAEYNNGKMEIVFVCYVVSKNSTSMETDLILCRYTLNFYPASILNITESTLGGLIKVNKYVRRKITSDANDFEELGKDESRFDYFRFKVLDAFAAEGLISRTDLKNFPLLYMVQSKIMKLQPVLSPESEENASYKRLQESLCSIECNPEAAETFKSKFKEYTDNKCREKVHKNEFYELIDFPEFLEDVRKDLRLPDKVCKELQCNYKYVREGEVHRIEFHHDEDELSASYTFCAIYKNEHNGKIDFMCANYLLEAKAENIQPIKKTSLLWGLINFEDEQSDLGLIKDFKPFEKMKRDPNKEHYFRKRVIDEFISDSMIRLITC